MANRRNKNEVDAEIDLHGLNVEEMRRSLQKLWPGWRGMQRVRLIHGRGVALKPAAERWCVEMGVPYAPEPNNPGALLLYPSRRVLPENTIGATLAEKGLRLLPEEEAYLRDPKVLANERQEALRRKQEEERQERLRRGTEAQRLLERRRDEALWQAEVARLDTLDKKGKRDRAAQSGQKPTAPVVLPPSEIKHQEGYWRAELVRVADTDTDTLKKQKRTGLEKLAPPMEARPATPGPTPAARPGPPKRNTEADQALFEEAMALLDETDALDTRLSKRGL